MKRYNQIPSKANIQADTEIQPKSIEFYVEEKTAQSATVYFDEDILQPSYYRNLLQFMRSMQEQDSIEFIMNTAGGLMDSATVICGAMDTCRGEVLVTIAGNCTSAGSMIALRAPNVQVLPEAYMMVHCASYGHAGKQSEVASAVQFNTRHLSEFIRETYEGFLTTAEIDAVLEGRDMYFDAEQIQERLLKREEYFKDIANQGLSALLDAESSRDAETDDADEVLKVGLSD